MIVMRKNKLHLGCGRNILEGYLNVDQAMLNGVDVAHDLTLFPWTPFADGQFDEVIMIDVLEHLPDVIRTLEEIHRITAKGGRVTLRVPYYNSWDASFDPTHEHCFNENSFEFFDPSTSTGIQRTYYTNAKFRIYTVGYLICPTKTSYLLCDSSIDLQRLRLPEVYDKPVIRSSFLKNIYTMLGHKIGNTIRTLHVELVRL